jgi:hypothetical protein
MKSGEGGRGSAYADFVDVVISIKPLWLSTKKINSSRSSVVTAYLECGFSLMTWMATPCKLQRLAPLAQFWAGFISRRRCGVVWDQFATLTDDAQPHPSHSRYANVKSCA